MSTRTRNNTTDTYSQSLALVSQDIEQRVAHLIGQTELDVPGPALLALLRISASLIALANDEDTFEAALSCAHDILDRRARGASRGTVH